MNRAFRHVTALKSDPGKTSGTGMLRLSGFRFHRPRAGKRVSGKESCHIMTRQDVRAALAGLCSLIVLGFLASMACGATFVDDLGRRVAIDEHPQRIISLAPNITETLFALGLDSRIVGVSLFSNYPKGASRKPRVGNFINPSLERIVALSPDLVIATANGTRKETVLQLERMGIVTYVIAPREFEDIFMMIRDLGGITGREQEALALTEDLRRRVDRVKARTKDREMPRVFLQIGINPLVSVGKDTIHNRLITLAGGINIFGDVDIAYPRVSIERVIAKGPDIIIMTDMRRGGGFAREQDKWRQWTDIPAVRNGRIYVIDSDVADRFSPRIVDGLEALAGIIHPEVMKQ